ncbi:hypothetical protein D1007_40848 [Hordeum vulgare]|nr:hypothetical protein D1007_40848 [Hordeum vulgare]
MVRTGLADATVPDANAMSAATKDVVDVRMISTKELQAHAAADDLWIFISGDVYDVTTWLRHHPGGEVPLITLAGQDDTDAFMAYHPPPAKIPNSLKSLTLTLTVPLCSIASLAPLCFPTTSLCSPTTVTVVESAGDPPSPAVSFPLVVMSAASSSSSAVHRRELALPLVRCPSGKEKVRMYISTTEKHNRWVYYKCQKDGVNCDFWHWELEYVQYLIDKHYLVGDGVVDDIGAAEERREELLKAQELTYMNGSTSCTKTLKNESANGLTRQQAVALMTLGRELVTLMKMLVGVVVLLGCAALVLIMFKM